jgi:hypothetical protein
MLSISRLFERGPWSSSEVEKNRKLSKTPEGAAIIGMEMMRKGRPLKPKAIGHALRRGGFKLATSRLR